MAEWENPFDEIAQLESDLGHGNLVLFRDKYEGLRRTRQLLQRYSSRVWLFPFGVRPDLTRDLDVWRNGLLQAMNDEVRLLESPVAVVVVFRHPTREDDKVQVSYTARPTP
jgi:hypothetical protein